MSRSRLEAYYERKYRHEESGDALAPIPATTIPTDRFQAVVKYFPRYFRGGDVLELAAGDGNVARTLLGIDSRISKYTVGELSPPRLAGIRSRIADPRLSVLEIDVEDIPEHLFGKYDAVIMVALIEHMIDPMEAMRRIRRLLKPSGFVYIDTPNIAKYTQRLKLLFGRFPSTSSVNEGLTTFSGEPAELYDEGHLHYFTYRSLSRMLVEHCSFSRVEKLSYPGGRTVLGIRAHGVLAALWPELFSELALIAHA